MLSVLFMLALLAQVPEDDAPPPDPPEELLAAQAARTAVETAHVVWTMDEETAGRRFFRSRFAGKSHLLVLSGDRDGAVLPDRVGQPGAYSEVRQLVLDDAQWVYVQDTATVSVNRGDDMIPMLDIRTVGFMPHYSPDQGLSKSFLSDPDIEAYEVLHDAGSVLITARFTHGRAVRWWLDPEQGFQPTRCAMFLNEAFRGQALTRYAEYDGVYFPRRVEYQNEEHEITRSIDVLFAAFNRPWHPSALGPADLGLLPGHAVNTRELSQSIAVVWDGAQVVARDAFVARVERGEVDAGPFAAQVKQVREQGGPGIRPVRIADFDAQALHRAPVLWEPYVQAYVCEKRLDLEAMRKSWALLDQAQARVYAYIESKGEAFERLAQLRAAIAEQDAQPEGSQPEPQQPPGEAPTEPADKPQPSASSKSDAATESAKARDGATREKLRAEAEALERESFEPIGKIFDALAAGLAGLKAH